MVTREARTLSRDVEVAAIPYGDRMTLTMGTTVFITQALGGSYTAMTDHGYLVRIEGKDADAIGEKPVAAADGRGHEGAQHAGAGLGPAQDLLRPGDPRQHRGPRPRLQVRGPAARRRRARRSTSSSRSPRPAAAWATSSGRTWSRSSWPSRA